MDNKKYLLFCNDELLLEEEQGNFSLPVSFETTTTYFIGNYNDHDCYAADVNELTSQLEKTDYRSLPIKLAFQKFDSIWHNAIIRGHQILQWDRNHQFCGKCGQSTKQINKHFEKHCSKCGLSFFPKLSPAVIVLIKKDKQILMARSNKFPEGVFALIAGFVEAGEALEDAVDREIYEEVGIRVKNIQYYGSQPWPFPDSLMVGFTADYESGEIEYRDGEIEIAGWYDVDNLPGLPSNKNSIAMLMIQDFIKDIK